eukprot:1195473-Prorocentrum_minimum.AAC.2
MFPQIFPRQDSRPSPSTRLTPADTLGLFPGAAAVRGPAGSLAPAHERREQGVELRRGPPHLRRLRSAALLLPRARRPLRLPRPRLAGERAHAPLPRASRLCQPRQVPAHRAPAPRPRLRDRLAGERAIPREGKPLVSKPLWRINDRRSRQRVPGPVGVLARRRLAVLPGVVPVVVLCSVSEYGRRRPGERRRRRERRSGDLEGALSGDGRGERGDLLRVRGVEVAGVADGHPGGELWRGARVCVSEHAVPGRQADHRRPHGMCWRARKTSE